MITDALIFEQVHRETASLARALDSPALATDPTRDEQLDHYLRHGALRIGRETGRIQSLQEITTAAGEGDYYLSADADAVVVAMLDGEPLAHTDAHSILQSERAAGTPTRYALWGNKLLLNALPESAGTIQVYLILNTAYTDTNADRTLISSMPSDVEPLLVDYVVYCWFKSVGAYDVARQRLLSFEEGLSRATSDRRMPRVFKRAARPHW